MFTFSLVPIGTIDFNSVLLVCCHYYTVRKKGQRARKEEGGAKMRSLLIQK